MKNAEIDALTTALALLRKIYIESEINDDAVVYITNDRFPRLHNELTAEIGKLERIIASGLNEPSKASRVAELRDALGELIDVACRYDGRGSFPSAAIEKAQAALRA